MIVDVGLKIRLLDPKERKPLVSSRLPLTVTGEFNVIPALFATSSVRLPDVVSVPLTVMLCGVVPARVTVLAADGEKVRMALVCTWMFPFIW
jgi:hypothetical protein